MKKIVTLLCCACLACAGYFITHNAAPDMSVSSNAMYAATVPNWNLDGQTQLPLDLVLDQAKINEQLKDTIHDTVLVEGPTKYVEVPAPRSTTDTLYMPLYIPNPMDGVPVNNKNPGSDKKSTVVLTVDGNIVYSTDGLKEP